MGEARLAMAGALENCLLFNFSVPAEAVRRLVPDPFELITFRGFAFWNVIAVRFRHYRPWPLPRFVGIRYSYVGYRLLVQHQSNGDVIRGSYTVRNDIGSRTAFLLRRLFSSSRCQSARVAMQQQVDRSLLRVENTWQGEADAEACVDVSQAWTALPEGSRFGDFSTARQLLDVPVAELSYDPLRREICLARMDTGSRSWNTEPVRVLESRWNFLLQPQHGGDALKPEPAFRIGPLSNCLRQRELIPLQKAPVLARPLSAMPLGRVSGRVVSCGVGRGETFAALTPHHSPLTTHSSPR